MSAEKGQESVRVVVKKQKGHGGGHHGGAWKVAYADFVTAMMALFIVLWIVGQNQEIKEMVSDYFKDPGAFAEKVRSGGAGILPDYSPPGTRADRPPAALLKPDKDPDKERLQEEKKKLEEMLKNTPAFEKFKDQVEITVSDEGLRIDLVEDAKGLFFDVGSARLKAETVQLLGMIAAQIGKLPNPVTVEGYTDARPYVTANYSNWELSVDRANTARKVLSESGFRKDQVEQVRGFADRRLKRPENPLDYANRRVSILVAPLQAPGPSAPAGKKTAPGG